MRRIPLLAAVLLAAVILTPTAALAGGKGSHTSSGASLQLVLLNSTDGQPHWGQQVTFAISQSSTDKPYVRVDCTQNYATVYSSSAGFFDSYPWPWQQNFTLSSSYWTGGAASCTAVLYEYLSKGRTADLASMTFAVLA